MDGVSCVLTRLGARHGIRRDADLLVTAASIGTKKKQASFKGAINDVIQQTIRGNRWEARFCPCAADPCLQIADYCTWAIQRKWEMGDTRSYDLIRDRIAYEYDLWGHGDKHHY